MTVSCAVQRACTSVQKGVVASQKVTWPGFTGELPATTVAVSVMTVCGETDATDADPTVMDRVVAEVLASTGKGIAASDRAARMVRICVRLARRARAR